MNETSNDAIKNSYTANSVFRNIIVIMLLMKKGDASKDTMKNNLAVLKDGEAFKDIMKDNLVVFKDGDAFKDVV